MQEINVGEYKVQCFPLMIVLHGNTPKCTVQYMNTLQVIIQSKVSLLGAREKLS